MKRIKIKYEELYTRENILKAIELYNKNRVENRHVLPKDAENVIQITQEIFEHPETIDFSNYRTKILKKSEDQRKERNLVIPCFTTLFIQTCMIAALSEELNRFTPGNSYSSRKGKGPHRMLKNLSRFLHSQKDSKKDFYVLYFDIHHFYESINRKILVGKIEKIFKDKRIINLFTRMIYYNDEEIGVPIGNACSHIFANIYLADILTKVNNNKEAKHAALYMDNWNIIGTNKRKLHSLRKYLFGELSKMNLSINNDWQVYKLTNYRGVKHGGYVCYRNGKIELYKDTFRRAVKVKNQIINNPFNISGHVARSYLSRMGSFKWANKLSFWTRYVPLYMVQIGSYRE